MNPKHLIDAVVQPLAEMLRGRHFRGSARRFYRDIGESRAFLEVQASQWNRDADASFTINLAVFNPEVLRKLGKPVDPPPKTENGCTWHERVGHVTPRNLDTWWTVRDQSSVGLVSAEVVQTVEAHAVPWLESAATYDGLRAILRNTGGVPAADLLWALGHREDAVACIRITPQNTSGRVTAVREWLQAHESAA